MKDVITRGIEENNRLDIKNILHIISKICDGLEYAHQLKDLKGSPMNIIHRDISPQNIFITFDGKVKIIDFGIAKASENSVQTQTGMIKGKLAYMSPEQAGGNTIDNRSDIFAVGVLLYELLTAKRMYKGSVSEILFKDGDLTTPPAGSAYYYYKEVLEIDDDNAEAKKGIQKIIKRKIELAKMVLSRFRYEAALEYINSGLAIEPANKELLELKGVAEEKVSDRIIGTFKTIFE